MYYVYEWFIIETGEVIYEVVGNGVLATLIPYDMNQNVPIVINKNEYRNISVEKVLRLIKESGGRVKLDPHKPNFLILQTGKIGLKEKSQFIREKLEFLL